MNINAKVLARVLLPVGDMFWSVDCKSYCKVAPFLNYVVAWGCVTVVFCGLCWFVFGAKVQSTRRNSTDMVANTLVYAPTSLEVLYWLLACQLGNQVGRV